MDRALIRHRKTMKMAAFTAFLVMAQAVHRKMAVQLDRAWLERVVSHPCDRTQSQGWGWTLLVDFSERRSSIRRLHSPRNLRIG
jgi:hypothetical protein